MKDKLKFLTKQSLQKKMKTKWFKIVNVLLLVLFLILTNIDRIVTFFGGDFNDEITIVVKDEVNVYDALQSTFSQYTSSLSDTRHYKIEKTEDDLQTLKDHLDEQNETILLHVFKDDVDLVQAEMTSYNEVNMTTKQMLYSVLQSVKESFVLSHMNVSAAQMNALTSPVKISLVTTNPEVANQENKEMIGTIASFVFVLPCFFLIILLVQMIGAEINDEKTTRSMEIIISNVSPKTHFLSKILASTLFVLLQTFLILLYGAIAIFVRFLTSNGMGMSGDVWNQVGSIYQLVQESGVLNVILKGLPLFLILFVSSFFLYAVVAGVLASMTTNIEDFQQLQTPMMIIIMIGYYLALMATQMEGAIFIKAIAFVPMLSFLLAPVLFIIGQFSFLELFFTTIVTVIFTYVIFHFGLRIYKVGILNYSSDKLWRKMFHSLKK